MTTAERACFGAGMGLVGAWLALSAMATFFPPAGWDLGPWGMAVFLIMAIPFLPVLAGPGALVLSLVHAIQMENWAPRARSVGEIRKVGVLLGLPLGVANLVLVFIVGYLLNGKSPVWTADMAPWLIPAIAGGAGIGWGVTTDLAPRRAASAATAPRPRAWPATRRDGPPFFDNRASRMIRRAG